MGPGDRILLILDLDETLVHASEEPLGRAHDFAVGPYFTYRRPHLAEFLIDCSVSFRLSVWSAGSEDYVGQTVARIMPPGVEPAFAWGRGRCVRRYDPERLEENSLKNLKKVSRRPFAREASLARPSVVTRLDRPDWRGSGDSQD
jgi:RNA polymerase II subunit A small phosphatase-like protein